MSRYYSSMPRIKERLFMCIYISTSYFDGAHSRDSSTFGLSPICYESDYLSERAAFLMSGGRVLQAFSNNAWQNSLESIACEYFQYSRSTYNVIW